MSHAEIAKSIRQYYDREVLGIKEVVDPKAQLMNFYNKVWDLLENVPYANTSNDDNDYMDCLLSDDEQTEKQKRKAHKLSVKAKVAGSKNSDDVDERIASIKNKLRQKKRPTSERAQKKRVAKKLKQSKGVQKLLSSAKSLKNENAKQHKLKNAIVKTEEYGDDEDSKAHIQAVKAQPVYNEEAKIVFSKIDFAANPGAKAKKSHKNPREILKDLKNTKQKISALKEQGDGDKAAELQNDIAWKKAFEKVEGKKVKDDPKLLYKALKKRKVEKKKAKTKWAERKQKLDQEQGKRQKKRQENLDKRSKDKKIKKLKKASKRGRIIPGY